VLEDRIAESAANYAVVAGQNERLVATLREARDQIVALKDEVDRLAGAPSAYGIVFGMNDDDTVDVFQGGRRMRVGLRPDVDRDKMVPGVTVILNEALNVVGVSQYATEGDLVTVESILPGERAIVRGEDGQRFVISVAPLLLGGGAVVDGERLLVDNRASWAIERLPEAPIPILRSTSSAGPKIVNEATERLTQLGLERLNTAKPPWVKDTEPHAVLVYGPPGCGKSAVIDQAVSDIAGAAKSMNINDVTHAYVAVTSLLSRYIGEMEQAVRQIFAWAARHAKDGHGVVLCFDQLDSVFPYSSNPNDQLPLVTTLASTLAATLDEARSITNLFIIAEAAHRDLIPPLLLRTGRFDSVISVTRPDMKSAESVLKTFVDKYALMTHQAGRDSDTIIALIQAVVQAVYQANAHTVVLEVRGGDSEWLPLYLRDFASCALLIRLFTVVANRIWSRDRPVTFDEALQVALAERDQLMLDPEGMVLTATASDWRRWVANEHRPTAARFADHGDAMPLLRMRGFPIDV
jgi:proteasome-associated ATPase